VALAVCLLFDRPSERAVRALWDRVEEQGVPSLGSHTHGRHVPHVSYAVLRRWDQVAVNDALAGLDGGDPVDLSFDGVGLFRRGRTWLVAGVSAEFVARQQRVVEAVTATGAELHKHYRPGVWLPHCSLAPRATLAQLPLVVAAVMDVLPLWARLDRAALVNSDGGDQPSGGVAVTTLTAGRTSPTNEEFCPPPRDNVAGWSCRRAVSEFELGFGGVGNAWVLAVPAALR